MKRAIVGSLTALLASAGLALAQTDEQLPRPRPMAASGPLTGNELTPEQLATLSGDVPPGPPGDQAGYGPPPTLLAPVCPGPGSPFRFWTEGDYHLWWLKKNTFPTLLEALPANGGPAQVLVGGDSLDRSLRNGGGLTLGGWVTDYQGFGLEGGFFVMESANKEFTFSGNGGANSPTLVRPFLDATSGQASILPISAPGLFSGSTSGAAAGVQCDSGRFAGADIHAIGNITCGPNCRWDFLIGYRYLTLDDKFSMQSTTTAIDGLTLGNLQQVTSIADQINTSSRFNGADFGLRWYWYWDRLMLRANARVAFGASEENASLAGVTSMLSFPTAANPLGVASTGAGGFLARPSNPGTSTSQFAVVPEGDLTLVYQLCDWLRFTVGYSFLYWSNVARSGGQVNLALNRLEVPALSVPTGFAPPPPLAQIHCTDFWAHGINVGLEFRY
jgi:hypothetical protein